MTPSINRLAESAKALGLYSLDAEWDLVREEFDHTAIINFEQFSRWVTGYMYYNALVCACGGSEQNIIAALEHGYDELVSIASVTV